MLHAAKSLSKGLRGLGESVAHSLAGGRSTSQSPSPPNADIQQPGVVTILDIEVCSKENSTLMKNIVRCKITQLVNVVMAILVLFREQ